MGTVNVTLGDATQLNLILGQQNENEVTEVVFDYSAWKTAYGSGTLALSVQRPGDQQPYAVVMTTSGDTATWEVSSLDTAYNGTGEIQLTYTVGTLVKKSVVYMFTVYGSIGANGEYPSPGQTWQQEIEADIADVKQDLSDLQAEIEGGGSGLTAELKAALDQLAQKVAYIDADGQTYYDALHAALYPPANLTRISCVYTQSGTVYDTDSLDSLKSDLVVTAHYSNQTTETVTIYALSGTLTAGTSTVTVSYGGKTTTFAVTVTATPTLSSISAVYTQSGTVYTNDSIDSLKSDLVVTAIYSDSSTEIVTTYTLSGTLTEGTSIITVSYDGKTTTFDVVVNHPPESSLLSNEATYSDSYFASTISMTYGGKDVVPISIVSNRANFTSILSGHTITKLKTKLNTGGVITIGAVDLSKHGTSDYTMRAPQTINVSSGVVEIELPTPLALGSTETLGIHSTSDTSRVAYKASTSDQAMLCVTADQFAGNNPGNALIFGTVYGY